MSRYVLLFLLNIPFVLLGLLNCIVSYKLKNISRRKFVFQVMLLFIVGFGLVFASSLYSYLFNHNKKFQLNSQKTDKLFRFKNNFLKNKKIP